MKKLLITLVVLLSLPFILRPQNVLELYSPFYNKNFLLTAAVMTQPERESILELSWPQSLIRHIADTSEFDFQIMHKEQNLTQLQFILTAYYDHIDKGSPNSDISYVLSFAKRAIEGGADVDNLARYGFNALHEAIVANDIEVVNLLLSHGASCNMKIVTPGKKVDGLNAFELTNLIVEKSNADREVLLRTMQETECNKSKHADLGKLSSFLYQKSRQLTQAGV